MLLKATLWKDISVLLAAIDGTGFSKINPIFYYIQRIDRKNPVRHFYKVSICIDVKRRKIIGLRVRTKRSHDILDVKYLVNTLLACAKVCLMDKGYDSEWVHEYLNSKKIEGIIPVKRETIPVYKTSGVFRKHLKRHFDKKKYHQRNLVESIISAIKQKFASAKAEIYCRAIANNLFCFWMRLWTAPKTIN